MVGLGVAGFLLVWVFVVSGFCFVGCFLFELVGVVLFVLWRGLLRACVGILFQFGFFSFVAFVFFLFCGWLLVWRFVRVFLSACVLGEFGDCSVFFGEFVDCSACFDVY